MAQMEFGDYLWAELATVKSQLAWVLSFQLVWTMQNWVTMKKRLNVTALFVRPQLHVSTSQDVRK